MTNLSRSLVSCASIALVLFASAGCDSCKKKSEQVKKEVVTKLRNVDEAPAPEDTFAEIVIKDPEAFTKRAIDGAGFGTEIGPSPWEKVVGSVDDDTAKKGLR